MRRFLAPVVPLLAALLLPPVAAQPAAAHGPGACGGHAERRTLPVSLRLGGLAEARPAGRRWTSFTLVLRNNTALTCRQVTPVVTFASPARPLRPGDLELAGARLSPALGELVASLPRLTLRPGATRTLRLRLRFARTAPPGRWITLALAERPLRDHGHLVAWPIGVSDPFYLYVLPGHLPSGN